MQLAVPVTGADHTQGPEDAPLTIVEYGDYQCPDAGRFHVLFENVLERHGSQIRFVYRHFPLAIHPDAEYAAEAAEAAGAQGKFFEMNHYLYQHQHSLEEEDFTQFAVLLNLDDKKFLDDLRRHIYRNRVRKDAEGGKKSGVHATPTVFLNGERYSGPNEVHAFMKAVESRLGAAKEPASL